MTKLVNINLYRNKRFAKGSEPDLRTLKKLIDDCELMGKKIGKKYYIEVDEQFKEFSPLESELMDHG